MSKKNVVTGFTLIVVLAIAFCFFTGIRTTGPVQQQTPVVDQNRVVVLPDGTTLTNAYEITMSPTDAVTYLRRTGNQNLIPKNNWSALRVYYGTQSNGSRTIKIVGIDEQGKEMMATIINPPTCPGGCTQLNG